MRNRIVRSWPNHCVWISISRRNRYFPPPSYRRRVCKFLSGRTYFRMCRSLRSRPSGLYRCSHTELGKHHFCKTSLDMRNRIVRSWPNPWMYRPFSRRNRSPAYPSYRRRVCIIVPHHTYFRIVRSWPNQRICLCRFRYNRFSPFLHNIQRCQMRCRMPFRVDTLFRSCRNAQNR